MKIKDKRSSFFMLENMPVEMSFAYFDEVDFEFIASVRPRDLFGSSIVPNHTNKVDADRTLLFFTTSKTDNITTNCSITSSSGETYTAVKLNSDCILIPGIKRGDFVKISFA